MTLAGRITDLVTALATALNARNAPGASDYQVWLAQGNTGTIDNYRASILGADMDFAARFQAALGTTPQATTATEARAGITQLAALADVLAGNTAKAISPGQVRALLVATSLADLNTKAAAIGNGAIITLPAQDYGGNGLLYRSVWYVNAGGAQPLTPLLVSSAATLTYLAGLVGAGKTYTAIAFDPGVSEALVPRANGQLKDVYRYLGATTGWYLWEGFYTGWIFQNSITQRNGGTSHVRLRGEYVDVHFAGITGSSAVAQYAAIVGAPASVLGATQDQFLHGGVQTSTWGPMEFYVSQDAGFRTLTQAIPANYVFQCEGSYLRTVPTS